MGFGARGPTRRRRPRRHVLPYFLEYAKPDPDRAPGGRRARSRLNREVGGETAGFSAAGPTRSARDLGATPTRRMGEAPLSATAGARAFVSGTAPPPSRLPVGDARPSVRIRASSATLGKAGGVTNGHRFHPPRHPRSWSHSEISGGVRQSIHGECSTAAHPIRRCHRAETTPRRGLREVDRLMHVS